MGTQAISEVTQAALNELKKLNPAFRDRVAKEPLAGTPLFEDVANQPSMTPPRFKKYSLTQLEAWKSIQATLGNRQQQVLLAIDDHGPCTAKVVAKWLQMPINVVVGRITELKDEFGLIVEFDTVMDEETRRRCTRYKVKEHGNT